NEVSKKPEVAYNSQRSQAANDSHSEQSFTSLRDCEECVKKYGRFSHMSSGKKPLPTHQSSSIR
ncbi:hypothetical protein JTM64_36755, partial [Pseudomonas aeruginosa]|nr:hypothetical protein [Pseudomonas aeruginosa]